MIGLLTQLEKVARSQRELASQQATMIAQNQQLVQQIAQLNAQLASTQGSMDEIVSQLQVTVQALREEGFDPAPVGIGTAARQIAEQLLRRPVVPRPQVPLPPPPYPHPYTGGRY